MKPVAALRLVETTLAEYGALTARALRTDLAVAGNPRRYLYDLVAEYPMRAGKMMRPSLCIATARIFGAKPESAIPTAVAIELLHNALLIHDDIEDGSERRRGRAALHVMHGIPLALNAGDRLLLMSLRPLMRNRNVLGDDLAARMIEEAERMAQESAEGQALELGWREEANGRVCAADYLEMVLKKTCWLATIFPMRAGALIGTRGSLELEPFIRFGFFLGAAFQIRDDLLNLSPGKRYGKELNGDLLEGKRTLMLIHLLDQAMPRERAEVIKILRGPRATRTLRQVSRLRALMNKYGCIDYAQVLAEELAGAALYEYSCIYHGFPDSRDKRFIEALALWVVQRS
jgi:geranylgeranyl diphosphate synthase type II